MAASVRSVFTFDYVGPSQVIGIGVALPLTCIAVVAMRFHCRAQQTVSIGTDDWLILGGLICIIGMGACMIDGAARHAMGYPTPPPSPDVSTKEQLLRYNPPSTELIGKLQFAFQLLMMVCYGFVKTSIVFFYRRIFVTYKRSVFSVVTQILIVVLILWTITFILIVIFPCGSHIYANWGTPASQLAYCQKIGHTSEEGLAASDLILDFALLVVPIPSIWSLHMTTTKKIAVTLIMMLGLSALAASIARLVIYVQLIEAAIDKTEVDQNQVITLSMWWSTLESGLALIAACLPTLTYLFTGYSIHSALRSVRSALSLGSLRSDRDTSEASTKNGRDAFNPYIDLERDGRDPSSSSRTRFVKQDSSTGQTDYDLQTLQRAKDGAHSFIHQE